MNLQLLIDVCKSFVLNVQLVGIILFIAALLNLRLSKKRYIPKFKENSIIRKGFNRICEQAFNLYKILLTLWFASTIIGLFVMIYFYILNIFILRNTTGADKSIYHPYKQYEVYYRFLYSEDVEGAKKAYEAFSFGLWLLMPFFLESNSMFFSYIGSTIFYQLWSALLLMKVIYTVKPIDKGLNQYLPLLLQIVTLNGLGPIVATYYTNRYRR